MSEYKINTDVLQSVGNDLKSIKQKLSGYGKDISSVANQLSFKISSREDIRRNLLTISENVGCCAVYAGNMFSATDEISQLYLKHESDIIEEGEEKGSLNLLDNLENLFYNFLGQSGIIGKFFSGLLKGFGENDTMKMILDWAKGLTSTTGAIFSFMADDSPDWLKLIGGNVETVEGFLATAKKEIGEFVDFSSFHNAGATVCKWAGTVLDGVINVFDYQEKIDSGDMSAVEGYTSAGVKTALDWGLDIAATAGVSAALAALGVTSAPAIVVGGGAVFCVWAADCVTEWISDGEYGSLSEWGTDMIVTGAQTIGDNISTAWDSLCDIFSG